MVDKIELRRKVLVFQQTNQELINANVLIQKFASMAAHDIKNPLSSIRLTSQALRTRQEISQSDGCLRLVNMNISAADNLLVLVDEMMAYSKNPQLLLEKRQSFELNALISKVVGLLNVPDSSQILLPLAKHQLHYSIIAVEQLLINLLSNAIRYNDKPEAIIHICFGESEMFYLLYYHFDIANKSVAFQESIRSNVTLLNNCSMKLNDIHLRFTSLWSNISKTAAPYIQRGLTDFHVIKCEDQRLTIEKYNQMYAESIAYLDVALNAEKGNQANGIKNVIVTHHVPTFQHYPAKYLGSILNEVFATDLNEFVESSGADYWIYGHRHAAKGDFNIGKTRLATNQLCYVHHNEHNTFDRGRTLDLE